MHFEVEHLFDAPIEAVEAAMFHPEYNSFLLERSDLLASAALESFEDDGMHIRRRVHLAPRPSIDHIGSKRVDPELFAFVEDSTWDRRTRKLSFRNIPTAASVAAKVINQGEVTLLALTPERTKRVARIEIKLHSMPLLARPFTPMIEQLLSREARRLLDGEARVMSEWLASRPAPAQFVAQA